MAVYFKDREIKYQSIIETANIGIWLIDRNSNTIFVNKKMADLLGYTIDEMMGTPLFYFMDDEMKKIALENVKRGAEGISEIHEFRFMKKDRTSLIALLATSPVNDAEGNYNGALAMVTDIADRKRAEEKILLDLVLVKESEKICAELNNFVELKDTLNTIMAKVQKLSHVEAIGIRLQDNGDYPYYIYHGFDNTFIAHEKSLCAKDKNGNNILDQDGNYLLECMCGNIIRGRYNPALPFFTAGGGFWSNNTTKLLATTTDADRQCHTRNYCNWCGYESVALIPIHARGETLGLIQLNDHRAGMFTIELIQSLEMIGNQIGLAVKNSFIYTKLKESELLLRQSQERYKRLNDELEQQVQQRTRELRDAQEKLHRGEKLAMVGKFTSSIGHEIRNPLAVINNSIYYLKMVLPNAEGKIKKHLDIIQAEVTRSQKIVTDLLDFSRVKPSALTDTNINSIIDAALSPIQKPANVDVRKIFDAAMHPIRADQGQLIQVFTNLINNAIEAMPQGGILELRTIAGSTTVEARVKDTGIGISDEHRDKIFQPLFSTKSSGMGLGLALVKDIVEKHDGTITFESTVGVGSTFVVRLPA